MITITRFIVAATAVLVAAACARAEPPDCPNASTKLTVDEYYLTLNDKKPLCTTVPGTITLGIKNPPSATHQVAKGDVTVTQKDGSPLTITGSNTEQRLELVIKVSGDPKGVTEAAFLIAVKGVGVLDPKVRVVDTNAYMSVFSYAIQGVLDAFGLDWEDAVRAMDMHNTEKK